jgi:hypothetical protein
MQMPLPGTYELRVWVDTAAVGHLFGGSSASAIVVVESQRVWVPLEWSGANAILYDPDALWPSSFDLSAKVRLGATAVEQLPPAQNVQGEWTWTRYESDAAPDSAPVAPSCSLSASFDPLASQFSGALCALPRALPGVYSLRVEFRSPLSASRSLYAVALIPLVVTSLSEENRLAQSSMESKELLARIVAEQQADTFELPCGAAFSDSGDLFVTKPVRRMAAAKRTDGARDRRSGLVWLLRAHLPSYLHVSARLLPLCLRRWVRSSAFLLPAWCRPSSTVSSSCNHVELRSTRSELCLSWER